MESHLLSNLWGAQTPLGTILVRLGTPLPVMIRALPRRWRRGSGAVAQDRRWRFFWAAVSGPWMVTLLHGVALWGWHAPAAFEAAYRDPAIHAAEHVSFLGTALLFWWSVLREAPAGPGSASAWSASWSP